MKLDTEYDVIIIGSGAGGAAAAWRLASGGRKVLLLESGPAYSPETDYRLDKDNWERQYFPAREDSKNRQRAGTMQKLDERWQHLRSWNHLRGDFVTDGVRRFTRYDHVVGVGGSTLHYTGEAHRLHPEAMKMKTRFGVAADWPLDYDELAPYYDIVERHIGVAGPELDAQRPRKAALLPAHALSYASQHLATAASKMKLGWQANHLSILSQPYAGRPACNYCNNCGRGCPRRDKGSADITFVPAAVDSGNCRVLTGMHVLRLQAGKDDRVAAVLAVDEEGALHEFTGRHYIVACGAVETPRLLLNSANAHAAEGLANESGHVGKNFMETLSWYTAALHEKNLGSWRGLPSDSICWDFNAPDAIPGVIGGARFSPYTAEADLIGPINYARRVVGGWGREHQEKMRDTFGHVLAVGAIGEHLPNENSYIDLHDSSDRHDMPLAAIHSHVGEQDLKRLDFMATTCRDLLQQAGADRFIEEVGSYDVVHASHVFGTCRMGDAADDSVVDAFGCSHRWRNLSICDASVFPSSGGGEAPSLTIEALAVRAADYIMRA